MLVENDMVASEGGGLFLWTITVKGDFNMIETFKMMVWQLLFWEEVQEKRPPGRVPAFWDASGERGPVEKELRKASVAAPNIGGDAG